MKITFLGTSHGRTEKGQFCSSTAITVNGTTYLIDAGAPITGLLQNYDIPFTTVKHIFITHCHFDHYVGLVEYDLHMNNFPIYEGVFTTVHVPDKLEMFKNFFEATNDGGKSKNRVSYVKYGKGLVYEDENIRFTAIPNQHMKGGEFPSYSFLVEAEGKRMVFTGDLAHDYHDYPEIISTTDVKLEFVVMEAAHALINTPENIERFRKSNTKRLIITHRCKDDGRNTDEVLADCKEKLKDLFPVDATYDGMVVEL